MCCRGFNSFTGTRRVNSRRWVNSSLAVFILARWRGFIITGHGLSLRVARVVCFHASLDEQISEDMLFSFFFLFSFWSSASFYFYGSHISWFMWFSLPNKALQWSLGTETQMDIFLLSAKRYGFPNGLLYIYIFFAERFGSPIWTIRYVCHCNEPWNLDVSS